MAHLPHDSLPSEFDVVVDGTGLTQSVLAAALSRVGKRVLHLDDNSFYGGNWASLMHRDLEKWILRYSGGKKGKGEEEDGSPPPVQPPELQDGEQLLELKKPEDEEAIFNVVETVHDGSDIEDIEAAESPVQTRPAEGQDDTESLQHSSPPVASLPSVEPSQSLPVKDVTTDSPSVESTAENEAAADRSVAEDEKSPEVTPTTNQESDDAHATVGSEAEEAPSKPLSSDHSPKPKVTWRSLAKRRFNYDIIPKLLYCRGQLVEAVSHSGVSRYLEFKIIQKLFSLLDGNIVQVPCSRSDVFNSKIVSMLEKRKLMKFLSFCADFDQQPAEYAEHVSLPFAEFLKHKSLTPQLIQFVLHCISMVDETTPTLEGLRTTQIFLKSLGRFGNTPFLYPLFGSGELPQAFCRMCAVFGGVYCLKRSIVSVLTSLQDNSCVGIVCSTGQRIKCSTFIAPASVLRRTLNLTSGFKEHQLSRAIFVTDGPITDQDEGVCLITLPPRMASPNQTSKVSVLQLDSSSLNVTQDAYMMHATCVSYGATARDDLHCVASTLFNIPDSPGSKCDGPRLLWSLYFNITSTMVEDISQAHSEPFHGGVYVTSDPDPTIGYEFHIKEAREMFQKICPNEEFLPAIPNPEDIVFDEPPSSGEQDKDGPSDEHGGQQGWEGEENSQPETEDKHSKEDSSQDGGSSSARSSE